MDKRKVTTEEKAICRCLRIAEAQGHKNYNLKELRDFLVHIDMDNDFIYGFTFYGAIPSPHMSSVIARLLDVEYVVYDENTFQIELTDKGRWFGDLFAFDDDLEKDLADYMTKE